MNTDTVNKNPTIPAESGETEPGLKQELTSARAELELARSQLNRTETGLKESLLELKDFQELFFSLAATIDNIVYRIDPEGRFTFINEAVSRLGYEPHELLGNHFSEIIWPADIETVNRQKVLSKMGGITTGEKSAPKLFDERRTGHRRTTGLEVRLKTKSSGSKQGVVQAIGSDLVIVEVNSTGMYRLGSDAEARVFIGTVGVIRDITDRKQAEKKILRQSAAIGGINRVFRTSLMGGTEDDLARACLTEALDLTGSSFGLICEIDAQGPPFNLVTTDYLQKDGRKQPPACRELQDLLGSIVSEGESRIIHDYPESSISPRANEIPLPTPPLLAVPLKQAKQTIGLILLAGKSGVYDPDDLQDVETLAAAYVESLMRKRAEHKLASRVADLSALNAMANIANLSLNVEVIAKRALDEVRRLVDTPACAIMLLDEKTELLLVAAGHNLNHGFLRKGGRVRLGQGVAGNVARSGAPTIIGDVSKFKDPIQIFTGVKKVKSLASIPLLGPDGVIGVMCLGGPRPDYFDQEMVELMEALGRQVALGITKARLYEKQQDAATIIAAERSAKDTINAMGDGLVLVDSQGLITFVNPAFEAMTGYSRTELLGRKDELIGKMLIAPEDLPAVEAARQGLKQGHTQPSLAINGLSKSGKKIAAIFTMSVIKDSKGSPTSLVMIVKDITEMRETQVEKERLEARLRQSEKLEALGTLAGGIAHDFNNLLTAIGGYAELIGNEAAEGSFTKESSGIIRQQVRQAAKLIRQILDFSRTSISTRHPLDLAVFLKEIYKLLSRTIPENIHIDLNIEPGDYVLEADPVGFQQLVTNLAVNSRDAMPKGGRLEISLKRWTLEPNQSGPSALMPPGDWLMLSVADNGAGMTPDLLPHVFEPFFTTKEVGQGTGLGLAQVYGLVEQHEGFIDLKSTEGIGTSITMYFPAGTVEKQPTQAAAASQVTPGQGQVIMLVEDDAQVRKLGRQMLVKLGYSVVTATDGLEALELYDRKPENIALVLTDMVMPNMGGRELIQALKYRDPDLKIIVWTGYYLDRDSTDLRALGVADCLMKPPDYQELATRIESVLQGVTNAS